MIAEGPIPDRLAGTRIFVTGSTGFLGTALVERLLRQVPDCELVLLVRPGKRSTVEQRVAREIFNNDAFDRLRAELDPVAPGDEPTKGARRRRQSDAFDAMTARRVQAVAGDVSTDGLGLDEAGRQVLASCDIVIHSAATVSFDSPLDGAVEVNLLGPSRVAATLNDLGVTPHMVAVSTCYVAGNRRGAALEEMVDESPFFVDVSWRDEVEGARRTRTDADATSRTPEKLAEFRKAARHELGAAGTPALAAKTEQLRARWVSDRLVEAGRARAASLGWPDAYAYTKALGERALVETHGAVPLSIVRPSIIESALAEPRPGWIRGFRMAEPVIISYARGLLKEFPGVPEGIVDVIPVDLVVGAIIAVAAKGPERGADGETVPEVVQVASGSQNPLRYRRLVDLVSSWFLEHPLYDHEGQPIVVPAWSFPGRGRVQGQLQRAKTTLERAERLLSNLPLRGKQAEFSATIEERREEAERALGYVELYGAYAECEAVYGLDRLLALWAAQTPEDQARFCFDPRVIDWDHYVCDVHLPSVVEHGRVRTTPGGRVGPDRETRLRGQVLSPDRQLAAFDLENTLIASNVVASYSWLATRRLPGDERLRFVARTLAEAPSLLALDRKDRSDFLRLFYRRYENAPIAQIDEDADEMFSQLILAKSFPAAIRRVREHRRLGHRTVLITGALDFVVEPLRPLFDDIVCASLGRRADGTYDGELTAVPPTGETRAQALMDFAQLHDLDLRESVAYADSTSDLPMLEAVGFPVAVNPETRLATLARKRGWLVENWSKSSGAPRVLVPIGARHRSGAAMREIAMKALQFERNLPRYAAAMLASRAAPGAGARVGPLKLRDVDPPGLPGPGWVRVKPRLAGICGSDLATIDGAATRYFEPIVSFPFVPGHEVVAELGDADGSQRVVLEPVLGCVTRGISPVCAACERGDLGNCERIAFGDLEPGLQSGFCCDTGGGWSTQMVAHPSQLHAVPDDMTDEAAVMVEPTACAIHGALAATRDIEAANVVVIGSGTLGLLTVAALRRFTAAGHIVVAAKHPAQREWAQALGATSVVDPRELRRAVRRTTSTMALGDGDIVRLTGGADVVVDCVGSDASLSDALAVVRPRGRIAMVGMPGEVHVDLTGLWQREITLAGAYAYGTEQLSGSDGGPGQTRRTFDLAFELVAEADLGRLVTTTYPLSRAADAITHAAEAGPRGAVKIAFDLRDEKERNR